MAAYIEAIDMQAHDTVMVGRDNEAAEVVGVTTTGGDEVMVVLSVPSHTLFPLLVPAKEDR